MNNFWILLNKYKSKVLKSTTTKFFYNSFIFFWVCTFFYFLFSLVITSYTTQSFSFYEFLKTFWFVSFFLFIIYSYDFYEENSDLTISFFEKLLLLKEYENTKLWSEHYSFFDDINYWLELYILYFQYLEWKNKWLEVDYIITKELNNSFKEIKKRTSKLLFEKRETFRLKSVKDEIISFLNVTENTDIYTEIKNLEEEILNNKLWIYLTTFWKKSPNTLIKKYKKDLEELEKLNWNVIYEKEYKKQKEKIDREIKYLKSMNLKIEWKEYKEVKEFDKLFNALEDTQNSLNNLESVNKLTLSN